VRFLDKMIAIFDALTMNFIKLEELKEREAELPLAISSYDSSPSRLIRDSYASIDILFTSSYGAIPINDPSGDYKRPR
jgi:hypothetical protein